MSLLCPDVLFILLFINLFLLLANFLFIQGSCLWSFLSFFLSLSLEFLNQFFFSFCLWLLHSCFFFFLLSYVFTQVIFHFLLGRISLIFLFLVGLTSLLFFLFLGRPIFLTDPIFLLLGRFRYFFLLNLNNFSYFHGFPIKLHIGPFLFQSLVVVQILIRNNITLSNKSLTDFLNIFNIGVLSHFSPIRSLVCLYNHSCPQEIIGFFWRSVFVEGKGLLLVEQLFHLNFPVHLRGSRWIIRILPINHLKEDDSHRPYISLHITLYTFSP